MQRLLAIKLDPLGVQRLLNQDVGIDRLMSLVSSVLVQETSVCIVDVAGKVVLERKVPTEPEDITSLLRDLGLNFGRVGIETGPLSQWLVSGLIEAGFPMVCVETRHMNALLAAQQLNKSDRNDAHGIAQMMRVGLFKPVHVNRVIL